MLSPDPSIELEFMPSVKVRSGTLPNLAHQGDWLLIWKTNKPKPICFISLKILYTFSLSRWSFPFGGALQGPDHMRENKTCASDIECKKMRTMIKLQETNTLQRGMGCLANSWK
eukprot:6280760-Amphidinium_carterae.1